LNENLWTIPMKRRKVINTVRPPNPGISEGGTGLPARFVA